MKLEVTRRRFGSLLAGAATIGLAPSTASAKTWQEVVDAANKEGEVSVHGGPGRAYSEALADNFRKEFPRIKINFTAGPASAAIPRVLRERESGVYGWDVFIGGAPSAFRTLKKSGAFAPLAPVLQSDIIADKNWLGGFNDGWLDVDKKFSYAFDFTPEGVVWVNWDFVARDRLRSIRDLLQPEFAGKITWADPRTLGEGIFASQVFYLNFGAEFLNSLFAQKIAYTGSRRQATEWMVRGRYPIGIGASPDDLALFKKEGLGKNIEVFSGGLTKEIGGAGYGCLQIMDRAPHPNAAAVYANWLLSQRGQSGYAALTRRNSRRLDVEPGNPEFAARKVESYLNAQAEDQMDVRVKVTGMAKEKIAAGVQ